MDDRYIDHGTWIAAKAIGVDDGSTLQVMQTGMTPSEKASVIRVDEDGCVRLSEPDIERIAQRVTELLKG